MLTLGEETNTLLKTKLFLISQRLQERQPNKKGKIGLIALKDHGLRKIPLKDPASGKYH
jgi:hypothetical protein